MTEDPTTRGLLVLEARQVITLCVELRESELVPRHNAGPRRRSALSAYEASLRRRIRQHAENVLSLAAKLQEEVP